MIAEFLFALKNESVEGLLKPSNSKPGEDELGSEAFDLRDSTFRSDKRTASLRLVNLRITSSVNIALTPSLLTFTNLEEALNKNLFAFRKYISNILCFIGTLSDLDEYFFHRFVHGRVVNIATVSTDKATELL